MTSDLAESFAEEWPRVVGATLRAFGSLDLAEESAQEAFARVAERMAAGEQIDNVGAWATITARRIAIDVLRRDRVLRTKLPMLVESEPEATEAERDDRLGLIFIACDPVLSTEQQVAVALRIVCGVPTADIAHFFGVQADIRSKPTARLPTRWTANAMRRCCGITSALLRGLAETMREPTERSGAPRPTRTGETRRSVRSERSECVALGLVLLDAFATVRVNCRTGGDGRRAAPEYQNEGDHEDHETGPHEQVAHQGEIDPAEWNVDCKRQDSADDKQEYATSDAHFLRPFSRCAETTGGPKCVNPRWRSSQATKFDPRKGDGAGKLLGADCVHAPLGSVG